MWSTTVPWTAPAFLAESLRQEGFRIQFLDYNIRLFHICQKLGFAYLWEDSAFFPSWMQGDLNYLSALFNLDEIGGGVIGFCTTQTNTRNSVFLAERIRKKFPNRKIIFGGHEVHFPEQVERIPLHAADAICKGEGEGLIVELMRRGFTEPDTVQGLYLPRENGWRLTGERPPETSLDTIPWPRYSEIEHGQYGKRYLALLGSRGCISNCVFCSERCRIPGYRTRSAVNQVDELEFHSSHFDIEHFPYYDSLANGNYRILREKSEEILRRGLRVDFSGNLMIRDNMPDDLFPLMRKSGFSVAFIGIESGSPNTLAAMRKRHSPDLAASFLRKCHNAGIRTEVNFIVGFPTETEADFKDTLGFITTNRAYIDTIISVNTFGLGPSDLWDIRDSFGIVIDNLDNCAHEWHTSDGQNTLDVRQERLERFLRLEEDLGLRGDCLISDSYNFEKRSVPTPEVFLNAYEAHFRTSRDRKELEETRHAASRVRDIYRLPTPPELIYKLVSNLRDQGLRNTFRRGREWLQIRRSRRSQD